MNILSGPHGRPAFTEIPLTSLHPGSRGIIVSLNTSDALKRRLMDLGLIEGAEIELIRTAPMGDPIEIRVYHTMVALRKSEAAAIMVHATGAPCHERRRTRHRAGR